MKRAGVGLKGQMKEKWSNSFQIFGFIASAFLKCILFICYIWVCIWKSKIFIIMHWWYINQWHTFTTVISYSYGCWVFMHTYIHHFWWTNMKQTWFWEG